MRKHRRDRSLFQLVDRKSFDALVKKWGVDKWSRNFKTWEFTCALVTSMIARLQSYREIEQALGIPRSTFGDAMVNRCPGFFEDLCDLVLLQIRARSRDRKIKKAIREILAIDSTECRVHGSLFSIPGWSASKDNTSRLATAKLHVVWSIDGEWIDDYRVTGVRRHDSPVGFLFELIPGKIYVFDRGYNNINFWLKIVTTGSHFVTRLKGQSITMMKEGKKAELLKKDGVLYDGTYKPHQVTLSSAKVPKKLRPKARFRYIVYRDAATKKVLHLVTSDFKLSAQTIADIYKKRWAIELLFRWLKGHFNIRYLEPKSTNAIRIQFAAAVLTQLFLQLKKVVEKYSGTLWEFLRTIRTSLVRESLSNGNSHKDCRWKTSRQANYPSLFL